MRRPVSRFVLVPILALPAAAGGVLVVDADSPGGFADIQAAVDVAADGDVVLLKTGEYSGFTIVDKDLTVVTDELNDVVIRGAIVVQELSAPKTVLLTGLAGVGDERAGGSSLMLLDNDGIVWVEGCVLRASPSGACGAPGAAVHVQRSDRVIIVRSDLHGAEAIAGEGAGGAGLRVIDSSVVTHNFGALGGAASWLGCVDPPWNGAAGGAGAIVEGESFLFSSADRYVGAAGGSGGHVSAGGNGGDGLVVLAPGQVESFESNFVPGAFGAGGSCGFPDCTDGLPGSPSVGDVHVIGGATTTITGGPPVREGLPVMTIVYAYPGARYAHELSARADFQWSAEQRGMRMTVGGHQTLLGHIPPSGVVGVLTMAPLLAPGEHARRIFTQYSYWGANVPRTLGSPRAIVVLDSSL